jgi:uncharacterized DUF497 family protein
MRFDWDPAKHAHNRAARGFGFDVAALIFAGHVIEWPDDRGSVRRIISARLANRKERAPWHASL